MQSTYQTIEAFYEGEPGTIGHTRKWSREIDFGVWWRNRQQPWPRFRVSFVFDTGELYAVRQAAVDERPNVIVLGVMLTPEGVGDLDRAEDALDGWAEQCGKPHSLQWAHERMVAAGATAALT